jgi:iron(III) transport system substrate-binding protein
MRVRTPSLLVAAATLVALTACAGGDAGEPAAGAASTPPADAALVIYSGRNETLVGGLLADLEKAVGRPVEVRYGGSSELAAQLLEEGTRTKADVFFSQDAGALGALAKAGALATLDRTVLDVVPARYRAKDGTWVGVSGRARVVAHAPGQVAAGDLPDTVDDLVDPRWKGKVAFAPTNASFHAFVTALRVVSGEDKAAAWLEAFKANQPKAYESNTLVLDAVDKGEAALGLINHYYWYEKVAELGADKVTARIHYLPAGDPAALVNVAGVGVLEGTDQPEAAAKAVAFLLGERAQAFFADETAEYPLRAGVSTAKHDLPALTTLQGPELDLSELDSLDRTLALLEKVGLT